MEEHREARGPKFKRFVFPADIRFGTTFSGNADFSEAVFKGDAVFVAATFRRSANFRGTTFASHADFHQARFMGETSFSQCVFEGLADFRATFSGEVRFIETAFRGFAFFRKSTFDGEAVFRRATFNGKADYWGTTFGYVADFRDTTFEAEAKFFTTFQGEAKFSKATFAGVAAFREATFADRTYFRAATFAGVADFREATFADRTDFWEATFAGTANFRVAIFENEVHFSDATFAGRALFLNTRFMADTSFSMAAFKVQALFASRSESDRLFAGLHKDAVVNFTDITYDPENPPRFKYTDFSKCRFLGTDLLHLDFTGVQWCTSVPHVLWYRRYGLYEEVDNENAQGEKWTDATKDSIPSRFRTWASPRGNEQDHAEGDTSSVRPWAEIERMYRELKHNYEKQQDYPRAGDFHVGEKEARLRHETRWGMKTLLRVYRSVSIYGERATPAALWLTLLIIVSAVGYLTLGVTPGENAEPLSAGVLADWGRALLLSLESTFFPVQSAGFEVLGVRFLNVFQRIASPILIALLALALRQRVRR